jgi:hypothetical protein
MSTDFLLQIAATLLLVSLLVRQLNARFTLRAEWPLLTSWFFKYGAAGVVVVALIELGWHFQLLPEMFAEPGPRAAILQSLMALVLMLAALFVLGRAMHDASCGCTDDDDEELAAEPEKTPVKPQKSNMNPFQDTPREPWSPEIAGRAAGGFTLGLLVAGLENVFIANGNWMLLLLRTLSVLPLYAAIGTILAWGIARLQRKHPASFWKALVSSVSLVVVYWLMVSGDYPLPFLSWFVAPPLFLGAWRFIGDVRVTKRPWNPWKPRPKKKDEDCEP